MIGYSSIKYPRFEVVSVERQSVNGLETFIYEYCLKTAEEAKEFVKLGGSLKDYNAEIKETRNVLY